MAVEVVVKDSRGKSYTLEVNEDQADPGAAALYALGEFKKHGTTDSAGPYEVLSVVKKKGN